MMIRDYRAADCRAIADLFHAAVHAIDDAHYSAAQREAWAPTPPDYGVWAARLERRQPLVAEQDGLIQGFIELEPDGHIDCFYVHPNFQRCGVATRLLQRVLDIAQARAQCRLYVEASTAARPLFESHGFELLGQNRVERRGQVLINYRMVLQIG
ncbi:GNAT family N-acetyltransferase [Marinobacterium rhizophilum]|uniref:GNAT family N-acetyltransferase n=1 Tax=Marinobacterium rhizophilum TaxID=420402 RepID=UPI000381E24E|nr:GNAT family N-acetyltransferase [Marinobacterium rhizophilum]